MSHRKPRSRRSTTTAEKYAARYDLDDVGSWPTGALDAWQLVALREGHRRLEAEVAEAMDAFAKIDEADTGMPTTIPLVARGAVHTLYKRDGGFIRYVVPSSCTVSCETVGCCDPRKKVSAGRE
jgi:hypothetical protein